MKSLSGFIKVKSHLNTFQTHCFKIYRTNMLTCTFCLSLYLLYFCLPLLKCPSYCLPPLRYMQEKSFDDVDDGFRERALPLEREYQRVSISGEEKCGVGNYF